jgi:hypothetical protein
MMLKLGIQCQEKHEEVYRYNRVLLPVAVKSINILDRDHYVRLAAENPGVELVYRQVPNGPWRDDPVGDGRRWAEHLYNQVGQIREVTLVEGHNEWVHAPPHNTPDDLDRADRFMAAFIDRVHELWGGAVHAVVLNASCGHFSEDIVDFFPRTLAMLQVCDKCLLGMHEYNHPDADMIGDRQNYLCGKFLRNLTGLRNSGYDKVRIAITECGVDSGVGAPAGSSHVGFKYWPDHTRYLDERNLGWYIPLAQETESIAWLTLFGCGMLPDWETFDIKNTVVIDGIREIYENLAPVEPEPPEPPNGGEQMDIKVYDFDGVERDWDWLVSVFGPNLRVLSVEEQDDIYLTPGDPIYKVDTIRAKRGYSSCLIQVKDQNGTPVQGKTVVWGWSDAPTLELADMGWNWTTIGDPGPTNETGDVGPGMGTGAYYHPDDPDDNRGPHWCWVYDLPSDYVEGIGMLSLTFHDHPDIGYREVIYQGEEPPVEPPPPPPGEPGEALTIIDDIGENLVRLREIIANLDAEAEAVAAAARSLADRT